MEGGVWVTVANTPIENPTCGVILQEQIGRSGGEKTFVLKRYVFVTWFPEVRCLGDFAARYAARFAVYCHLGKSSEMRPGAVPACALRERE